MVYSHLLFTYTHSTYVTYSYWTKLIYDPYALTKSGAKKLCNKHSSSKNVYCQSLFLKLASKTIVRARVWNKLVINIKDWQNKKIPRKRDRYLQVACLFFWAVLSTNSNYRYDFCKLKLYWNNYVEVVLVRTCTFKLNQWKLFWCAYAYLIVQWKFGGCHYEHMLTFINRCWTIKRSPMTCQT